MSPRGLARLFLGFAVAFLLTCVAVHRSAALRQVDGPIIASLWRAGAVVARAEVPREDVTGTLLEGGQGTLVFERIVAEAPVLRSPELALSLAVVSGHDGLRFRLDDKTVYFTPDDLVAMQAYDHGLNLESLSLGLGVDVPLVVARASSLLGVRPPEVLARAEVSRIRTERRVVGQALVRRIDAATLTDEDLRTGVREAAHYLARGVSSDGHFRYLVNAPTNESRPGYDWPRHAGATYFVAQAARVLDDAELRGKALRAAALLRDGALGACGTHRCIGTDDVVEIGSAALAIMAFAEIARSGADPGYAPLVRDLADFVLSQQRADGEFMHEVTRAGVRIDVQFLYFSGEATLALSRAHELLGDAKYLDGATRGLAHLVGPAWSFFGDRYYFGEEHWTCQVMGELWDRAPSREALEFCMRWHAYGRAMQQRDGDSPFDGDGAYQVGPVVTPRLTPVASRSEAGVATLAAAEKAGWPKSEVDLLRNQLRHSLALLLRHQLPSTNAHLFADPEAVRGALPGSEVDWALRIDYAQHAGSAMVRWLELPPAR